VEEKSGKVARKPANPWGATVSACPLLKIKVGRKWANGQFFIIFGPFSCKNQKISGQFRNKSGQMASFRTKSGQQNAPKLTCY
jgi:hypothetical protein